MQWELLVGLIFLAVAIDRGLIAIARAIEKSAKRT